jgi:hypothetical protein
MSLINVSFQHGTTAADARAKLRSAVGDVQQKFGVLLQRTEWRPDESVKVSGKGFEIDMRVDADRLYISGDVSLLGGLLAGPFVTGLKQILTRNFPKQLP